MTDITYETIRMVQDSWETVMLIEDVTLVAGESLFRNIFALAPESIKILPFGKGYENMDEAMFKSEQFKSHARMLVSMLNSAISMLGPDLQVLQETLKLLGSRHINYAVFPEHYSIFTKALLMTLRQTLGRLFTCRLREAWSLICDFITSNMINGANEHLLKLDFRVYALQGEAANERLSLEKYIGRLIPTQTKLFYVTKPQAGREATLEKLIKGGVPVFQLSKRRARLLVPHLEKYLSREMVNVSEEESIDLSFLDSVEQRKENQSLRGHMKTMLGGLIRRKSTSALSA